MTVARDFLGYSRRKLDDYRAQIERCVGLCTPADIWHRANEHSNSIGNLLLHLRGNVTQWIVAGLGGRAFQRDRPAEFSQREPLPAETLLPPLAETVRLADAVMAALSEEDLRREYGIQGYRVTGLQALYHVVEHFGFHTGQIVTMTKALKDCDLSLYDTQGRRFDGRERGVP